MVKAEGDHEKWELITSDSLKNENTVLNMDIFYDKDTISVIYAEGETEKSRQLRLFDNNKNLIEKKEISPTGEQAWAIYEYEKDNTLHKIRQNPHPDIGAIYVTLYKNDEFDNEGNWLKRYEYGENGTLINVIHRRIEYRNQHS